MADGRSEPDRPADRRRRAKAEQALADLKAGKDWETIAKSVSTDASKDQAGDLGFIDKNSSLDPAFVDATAGCVQGHAHRTSSRARTAIFRIGA